MNHIDQTNLLHDLGVGRRLPDGSRLTRAVIAGILGVDDALLSQWRDQPRYARAWTPLLWARGCRQGEPPDEASRRAWPEWWALTCRVLRELAVLERDFTDLDQLGPRLREWGIEVDVEALMAAHGERIEEAFMVEGWAGVLVVVREVIND